MNSSKVSHGFNRLKCAFGINEPEQRAALDEMEKLLRSMKFGNASESRQRKEMMQFQKVSRNCHVEIIQIINVKLKGMICAIKGAVFLFEQLKNVGFKYLMTTKVNK